MSAVLVAELGAVRWSPVLGAGLAAAALVALDVTVWPRGPGSELALLVAGLLGGSAALALDDRAAAVTAAVPAGRRRRTTARLVVALAAVAAWCGYAAFLVSADRDRGEPVSWPALALAGATLVVVGTGIASTMGRSGATLPGAGVASAMVVGVLGLMVVPLPGGLGLFDVSTWRSDATAAWSALTGIGLLALLFGTADPWRRTQRP